MMKRALIIEDDIFIAMGIQDVLEAAGYEQVEMAVSAAEAICIASNRSLDLITAEDRLENGSGIDAVREISRDQSTPVLFIVSDPEQVLRKIPGALVLEKPFTQNALAAAIEELGSGKLSSTD